MLENYIKGLPSLLFMRSIDYVMSTDGKNYVVSIPKCGSYKDLAPDFFTDADGEFNLFDDKSGVFYLPSITKVLLAANKYPDLAANQVAVPISIKINADTVDIVYNVLSMFNFEKGEESIELPDL